ncbi:MAG: hypothetical protein WC805_03190 [Patescibacteria group bacterium]|jgi:hypothetical protein
MPSNKTKVYHGVKAIDKFLDRYAHPIPDQDEYNKHRQVLIGLQEKVSEREGELIVTIHFRDTRVGGNIFRDWYGPVLEFINVAILPPTNNFLNYQSIPKDNVIDRLFSRDALFSVNTGGYAKVHIHPPTTDPFIEWREEEFPLVDGDCLVELLWPEACSRNNTKTTLAIGNQDVANIWKGANVDLFKLFQCIKQAADLVSTTLNRPIDWDADLKEIAKLANIRTSKGNNLPVKTVRAM